MSKIFHLPNDLLTDIAKLLKTLEDYTCFRCVSKSFQAAAKEDYFEGLPFRQHIPYLMLSVREGGNDDIREVYSLVENESIVASSVKVPNFKRKSCLESLGWLLVNDEDCNSCLLNPFSGYEIPLPRQTTFPGYTQFAMFSHYFFEKMVLSSNPNETSDFILLVIAGSRSELAFWRLGDQSWTKIDNRIDNRIGCYTDVAHGGGGKFYAFCRPVNVLVYNLTRIDNQIEVEGHIILSLIPPHAIRNIREEYKFLNGDRAYLLKTIDDSLILITRSCPLLESVDGSYITTRFQAYDLDLVKGTWKEIYSLGSMAVFLGHNSTIFVDASRYLGAVKANHIYFTDDNWQYYYSERRGKCGGYDSGVYNFETGIIEPVYPGELLLSKISPSLWLSSCV